MASVFRKDDNFVEQPNRNTYDMSFQNNLTLDFGSLRPCFIQPVSPGDSWSIEPTFGLRFLPMVYPVQTRMKASIHYFYVRNRNLWKDWPDFIGKTKDGLVPPYINLNDNNRRMVETCQLGDFLGIPTRVYGSTIFSGDYNLNKLGLYNNGSFASEDSGLMYLKSSVYEEVIPTGGKLTDYASVFDVKLSSESFDGFKTYGALVAGEKLYEMVDETSISGVKSGRVSVKFVITPPSDGSSWAWYNDYHRVLIVDKDSKIVDSVYLSVKPFRENQEYELELLVYQQTAGMQRTDFYDRTQTYGFIFVPSIRFGGSSSNLLFSKWSVSAQVGDSTESLDVADMPLSSLPWRSGANPNGIPLSALPFRAYESIYNAFYRNAENNPLLINGVPEYNKWIRTNEGGADNNFYPIMYHNWEDDFLTTAVPSPQQGNAPLVGLSGTPTLTIAHDDGSTTTAQLDVDDDGSVVAITPMSGDEPTQQSLIEAVSYGISINDFRNVNSFQRWLENNIRRGYKYRDQIKTHYGVSVRYDELDMPEFIGGTSEPVMVNQISQTVPTDSSPLGDMAGQASAFGQGRTITHYCDEHGFIIGIICVKPVANYSQLLPKYFNVTDAFDYYFPEFGHIGMQPITYAEVTPLQSKLEGKLDDVFGYQRAWYDLISKTDEVHGLFRSDFRNFLINRTFDGTPELGKEFTVMDPDQINDVFAYTENTDKILGQVFMKCSKKTPIPLYGIPKLE